MENPEDAVPKALVMSFCLLTWANSSLALNPSTERETSEEQAPVDLATAAAFVVGFDAGPCVYLRKPFLSGRSVRIDAFGAEPAPLESLDASFKRRFDAEANIYLALISQDQCPLLDAAVQLGWAEFPGALISVSQDAGHPDAPVTARFSGSRTAALFLVRRSGRVTAISPKSVLSKGTLRLVLPPNVTPREGLLVAAISFTDAGLRDKLTSLTEAPDGASSAEFAHALQEGRATGSLHPIELERQP